MQPWLAATGRGQHPCSVTKRINGDRSVFLWSAPPAALPPENGAPAQRGNAHQSGQHQREGVWLRDRRHQHLQTHQVVQATASLDIAREGRKSCRGSSPGRKDYSSLPARPCRMSQFGKGRQAQQGKR